MRSLDVFLADVGASQLGWPESLRFTYDKTRELLAAGVPGDLVECGVGAGCHPAVMARACIDAAERRTIRMFDSFQGIPHGGEHDHDWNAEHGDGSGRLEPTGVSVYSTQDVLANLGRWLGRSPATPPIRCHVGWFQASVPRVAADLAEHGQQIAFLRLDGDLYESYRVCLEQLYPLVASGGAVVVDDWNLDGCRRAVTEYLSKPTVKPSAGLARARSSAREPLWEPERITESGDVWWNP